MTIMLKFCPKCNADTFHEWRYDKDQEPDEQTEMFNLVCLTCETGENYEN